jgi:hypothetical protein
MKKSLVLASLIIFTSSPVYADDLSPLFGSVIGGVLGSQFGSGTGQAAMTALGAVVGYRAGSTPNINTVYGQTHIPTYSPTYSQQGFYSNPCSGEMYYEGRYDPQLAQSYCRGRQEYLRNQREQELFNARQRGMAGN